MFTTKLSPRNLLQYFDIAYLLKFLLLFGGIYFFNLAYFGLTSPYGSYHMPFLENNLNYVSWLKTSILYTSNEISHLIGIDSYVRDFQTLKTVNGTGLGIAEACLGFGVLSFWMAYIIADNNNWKRKLLWCLGGMITIWLINCMRVAFMLLAIEKNWELVITSDYHTAFNVIAYAFVFLQIFIYNKFATAKSKPS